MAPPACGVDDPISVRSVKKTNAATLYWTSRIHLLGGLFLGLSPDKKLLCVKVLTGVLRMMCFGCLDYDYLPL